MARNVQAWLDARGRGAWLAAMILGFVFVWPVGLALLAYMIWSKRMFNRSCGEGRDTSRGQWASHFGSQWGGKCGSRHGNGFGGGFRSSGNTAFDAYKEETLRRLQDEQEAFQSFLQRLREAKDKTEFDAFMEDRAKSARPATDVGPSDPGRDGNL
jgi:predicted CopG family antitoxin